ncbi:MAG: hypothetical protein FMNOHCHN_03780 [Ignavibacteriaceae bacterium]|nr:hypothetical protein [Ignavibacteriaceae bacterium]
MKLITIRPVYELTNVGRRYVAICDYQIIAEHFCSTDEWAKRDLGFYKTPDSQSFGEQRRALYSSLYPEGYEVIFSEEILTE